ncbi:carnosine synthase 1 [Petromyzon marinus]|uniref:carnosine synthase 1 n=1 Tax=Petromyzon marinus TaxID=7757 RepID=UPI003F6FB7DB
MMPSSVHGCRVDKSDQGAPLSLATAYWSVPPSLHGPKDTSAGDTRLLRAYESLQRCLQEAGLPETVDRTNETRLGSEERDSTSCCVCVLANPADCMALLDEGSRECPGRTDVRTPHTHTWPR